MVIWLKLKFTSNIDTKLYYENKKENSKIKKVEMEQLNKEYKIMNKKRGKRCFIW